MNRHQKGFTLIEMLTAITILSIMMTLLFASMRIAGQNWQAGQEKISQNSIKQSAYRFFSHHLTRIFPYLHEVTMPDKSTVQKPVFQGEPERIQFISALPLSSLRKGLYLFQLYSESNNNAKTLYLKLTPYRNMANQQTETEEIIPGISKLAFSYFGNIDSMEEPGHWHEKWTDVDHLPSLIKVEIALTDGSIWPEMIFPLQISTENIIDIAGTPRTRALQEPVNAQ